MSILYKEDWISKLKDLGYTWEVTADGYRVWYKDDFIGGAGVQLPRSRPLHWQHARKNREDNLNSVLDRAIAHAQSKLLI